MSASSYDDIIKCNYLDQLTNLKEARYHENMKALLSMGFSDFNANLTALKKENNLESALTMLMKTN